MDTVLLYTTFGLTVASLVLHFLAPRTKNTVDDRLAAYVDRAVALVHKDDTKI